MGIIAIYYGTSSTEAGTIAAQSNVSAVVLNSHNGPYKSNGTIDSNVQAMVTAVQNQGTKAYGYVDTGGSNMSSCATTVSGDCTGTLTKAPSLCLTNPSGGVWNHWAYDSSELNLGNSPSIYTHCYLNYNNGTLRTQVEVGAITSGTFSCATVLGYIKEQVDQWLSSTGFSADGIWFDNSYVGSVNDTTTPSTDNRYTWYKKLCDYVSTTYSGDTILNAGSAYGAEYWHDGGTLGGSPFFTYMNVQETTYNNSNSNFPGGTVAPGNTIPSYISGSGKPYSSRLLAVLKSASGISSANVTAWYADCCTKGIGNAYIATDSGGGFTLPSGNATIALQNTAAGASGC